MPLEHTPREINYSGSLERLPLDFDALKMSWILSSKSLGPASYFSSFVVSQYPKCRHDSSCRYDIWPTSAFSERNSIPDDPWMKVLTWFFCEEGHNYQQKQQKNMWCDSDKQNSPIPFLSSSSRNACFHGYIHIVQIPIRNNMLFFIVLPFSR